MGQEIRLRDVLLSAGAAALAVGFWFWQRRQEGAPPTFAPSPSPQRPFTLSSAGPEPDPLEQIQGIGAVYADRLRAAGIRTFADLAALTPERARELAQAQEWQADAESWIRQAQALVQKG